MDVFHIGYAHIIPRRDGTTFPLLYSFKYMCASSILRNAYILMKLKLGFQLS